MAIFLINMFSMTDKKNTNQCTADILNPSFWQAVAGKREGAFSPWNDAERGDLLDFARKINAPEAVEESIEKLGDPQTLVVVAGQQVGLFLSPLYVIYKAAGAIMWARQLEEWLGRPVRPVFWIASEDHDYDEIRKVNYQSSAGQVMDWQYDLDVEPGTSMFDVPCDEKRIDKFLECIREETRETEFRDSVLERWAEHAEAAYNLEEFFARGLMDFFGEEGLIPFSSNGAVLRSRAAKVIRREIEKPCETSSLVKASDDDAIHRKGDEANFFLYRNGKRAKVRYENKTFVIESLGNNTVIETLTSEELLAELEASPGHFSPNVITRPVAQDTVLPVIAMIGGPGERRYLRQLRQAGVYESLGVVPSVTLPRPRGLLLEPNVEKSLEKLGLDDTILVSENTRDIREKAALNSDFGQALEAMEQMESKAEALFDELRPQLGQMADNPAVASAMKKTLGHWKKGAAKMTQRVRREIELHDAASQHHLDRVLTTIKPGGVAQERHLGPLAPFQLHYCTQKFAKFILENLRIDAGADLQVLRLSTIYEE